MTRISELRRRDWRTCDATAVSELSAAFCPGGQGQLRLIQAMALRESFQLGGVFLGARVGAGKTLAAGLLATAYEDQRPLVIVPGGHLEKTEHELGEYRKAGWQLSHKIQIVTYNDIARDADEKVLRAHMPGRFICDEADKLRRVQRGGSGTAARINDWMVQYPSTRVDVMTGTFFKEGLRDYGHLINWALRDSAPVPRLPEAISNWHKALKGAGSDKRMRTELGIGPDDDLKKAFRERLWHSPGVIISIDSFSDVGLTFRKVLLGACPELEELYTEGTLPGGWDVVDVGDEDAESVDGTWAVQRQLALDFYYTPSTPPPAAWAKARRQYFRWVRKLIAAGGAKTELQARRLAIEWDEQTWKNWAAIQPTFEPRFVPVWLGDRAINYCREWGRDGGIVWTAHRAFAERLSAETGWAWFAGGGVDRNGRMIETCRDKTIIASIQANGTGRNLQHWHRALCTAIPSNGRDFEQWAGRQHRDGQKRDVQIDILFGCRAHHADLQKVFRLSREEADEMGRINKCLTATWQ